MVEPANAVLNEARLVVEAARDTQAFLALYDRYFPRVYTYFRCRCADLQACDDLTAQTFEQALTHLRDFDPERGSFAAWLFGIARNNANAALRQKLRTLWLPLEALLSRPGNDPPPEEAAIAADRRSLLASCVRALPPRQRDLLALKFMGELTNRQIAEMSGLSEQNVAVILHRSLHDLRERMNRLENSDEC